MIFLPKYLHFNGLKLIRALEEYSITSRFFGSKCKTLLFEEYKRFECSFNLIKVQVITNPSSRLVKTSNTRVFVYDRFFMIFYKFSAH